MKVAKSLNKTGLTQSTFYFNNLLDDYSSSAGNVFTTERADRNLQREVENA